VGHQLYRRLPQAFVEGVLEAFNAGRMTEADACTRLGLKRSRSYCCGEIGCGDGRPGRWARPASKAGDGRRRSRRGSIPNAVICKQRRSTSEGASTLPC
jgi:hypothetical protein